MSPASRRPAVAQRRRWTADEDALLVARYPHEPTAALATQLRRTLSATFNRARGLGLAKSAAYLSTAASGRMQPGSTLGLSGRFGPGHVPANKGLRRPGWHRGRMRETQFRPGGRSGAAARNWRPIGTILVDPDGYRRIKVRDARPGEHTGFGNVRVWPMLQRHVWEQAHGPIPPGHSVVFKNGRRDDVRLENLELLSREELLARNTIHRLPKPLADTCRLLGALNRQIRKRTAPQRTTA